MNFALILNGIVDNTIICESVDLAEELNPSFTVINIDETSASIGWSYDGSVFTAPPLPPIPQEQLIAQANSQKSALISEASAVIAPLADAQAGGYIDEADVPRLTIWQKYRYVLTKVDTSTAPDITWPVQPSS